MPYSSSRKGACDGRCTCCPYGCTYVAPVILSVFAMILTWGTTFGCGWYKSSFVNNELLPEVTVESSFRFGPIFVQDFNVTNGLIVKDDDEGISCKPWSDHSTLDKDDLDTPLVFSRTVLLIITIPVFIFFIIFLFGSCCVFETIVLKIVMVLFIIAGVFYPLGLVSMATKWCKDANDCTVQGNFITAWIVFGLWIAAGVSIIYMREKNEARPSRQPQQSVEMTNQGTGGTVLRNITEQTVVEPDGTVVKVTTETSTAPDGTRTVTETREVLQAGKGAAAPAVATADHVYDEEIPVAKGKPVTY